MGDYRFQVSQSDTNFKGIPNEEMLQRVTKYVEHLQREDHINDEEHQKNLDVLEQEFYDNKKILIMKKLKKWKSLFVRITSSTEI